MTVLVLACEVGSVRAILPVCNKLLINRIGFVIGKCGCMNDEAGGEYTEFLVEVPMEVPGIYNFFLNYKIDIVLFSPNIDPYPTTLARFASLKKIPTFFILDYWNGYVSRLQLDRGALIRPTKYFVPDRYAADEAAKEGVSRESIMITGHPNMCVNSSKEKFQDDKQVLDISANYNNGEIVLFVSEPAAGDQGESLLDNPNFRGYTEYDSLSMLLNAVRESSSCYWVLILPHPRQNVGNLKEYWSSIGGDDFGGVVDSSNGVHFLKYSNKVAGMASTLLYRAWLLGKSVISIQPGLINKSLRVMKYREGVVFVDKKNDESKILEWLKEGPLPDKNVTNVEIKRHCHAADTICQEIIRQISSNRV